MKKNILILLGIIFLGVFPGYPQAYRYHATSNYGKTFKCAVKTKLEGLNKNEFESLANIIANKKAGVKRGENYIVYTNFLNDRVFISSDGTIVIASYSPLDSLKVARNLQSGLTNLAKEILDDLFIEREPENWKKIQNISKIFLQPLKFYTEKEGMYQRGYLPFPKFNNQRAWYNLNRVNDASLYGFLILNIPVDKIGFGINIAGLMYGGYHFHLILDFAGKNDVIKKQNIFIPNDIFVSNFDDCSLNKTIPKGSNNYKLHLDYPRYTWNHDCFNIAAYFEILLPDGFNGPAISVIDNRNNSGDYMVSKPISEIKDYLRKMM